MPALKRGSPMASNLPRRTQYSNAERLQLVTLIDKVMKEDGVKPTEAAAAFGVSPRSVSRWRKIFKLNVRTNTLLVAPRSIEALRVSLMISLKIWSALCHCGGVVGCL